MTWVTIKEAADLLNVSTQTIRRIIKADILPSRLQKDICLVKLGDGQEIVPIPRMTSQEPELLDTLFKTHELFRKLKSLCLHRLAQEKTKLEEGPELKNWGRLYLKIEAQFQALEGLVNKITVRSEVLLWVYLETLVIHETWILYGQCDGNHFNFSSQKKGNKNIQTIMKTIIHNLKTLLILCLTIGDLSVTGSDTEFDRDDDE
jgi:Helix-turn-helix domain